MSALVPKIHQTSYSFYCYPLAQKARYGRGASRSAGTQFFRDSGEASASNIITVSQVEVLQTVADPPYERVHG